MKIVICGAGRVGMSIAEHLSTEENDITVIDSSIDAIQKITELYDVQGVHGLASYPNILKDAGISDAEMIIAGVVDASLAARQLRRRYGERKA